MQAHLIRNNKLQPKLLPEWKLLQQLLNELLVLRDKLQHPNKIVGQIIKDTKEFPKFHILVAFDFLCCDYDDYSVIDKSAKGTTMAQKVMSNPGPWK